MRRRLIPPGRRRRSWPTTRSAHMQVRNWPGTGRRRIQSSARKGRWTKSSRPQPRYTHMSSTTRRRRPTSLKCPGFSNSPTTQLTYNICSRGWHGGPAPPSVIHSLNGKQTDLSDQLVAAWTNFAWTGNPNGLGNYPWPRYTGSSIRPQWLIQNIPALSTLTDPQYDALRKCDFWDLLAAY